MGFCYSNLNFYKFFVVDFSEVIKFCKIVSYVIEKCEFFMYVGFFEFQFY